VIARKRGIYARILITPNCEGHNSFNASEVFVRGRPRGFPSPITEVWPDIATHVLHWHP
jgi:hypothetical protein